MSDRPLPAEPLFTPKRPQARGVSVKNLMGHVAAGRLRFINVGNATRKKHRFTTYSLQTFIENQKVRETPKCPSSSAPQELLLRLSSPGRSVFWQYRSH